MSPNARRPASASSGLRVAAVVVLLIALVGAWLPSQLAGAAPERIVSQTEPEQSPPPEQVDGGEASLPPVDVVEPVVEEPVPAAPAVEPSEAPATEPPALEPVEVIEPEPVRSEPPVEPSPSPTPPPTPEPTPEPWGPARVQLIDPLVAPVVPAGSEATFVLEVDHLGAGGPDAKELRADAPVGWAVRFAPNVAGEGLSDADGDGWPETRPLSVNDRTFVTVIVTTPVGLTETSTATIRVTASSFGQDQDAFRNLVDLSVTAIVPEPTPPPSAEVEPSPGVSPSPSASGEDPDASASADPSTEGQASASPSDGADSSASGSADPSGESSPSASDSSSASPSESASGSASPSASPSPTGSAGVPTIVAVPAEPRPSLVAGETTEVRHGFAIDGIADDETVTLAVRVAVDPAWLVTVEDERGIDDRTVGDGAAELTISVTGGQTVGILVRVAVPDGIAGGTSATLDISAEILTLADDGDDALLGDVAEMGVEDAPSAAPVRAETSYDLVVESVESVAMLSVEGGAAFGTVNVVGDIDPSTSGVTSTVDDNGATYTQTAAVTLTVSGVAGAWSISCGTISETGPSFQWRESGGAWQSFPVDDGPCITGNGLATIVIDIRLRIDWVGSPGSLAAEVTFTLQDESDEVARPLED